MFHTAIVTRTSFPAPEHLPIIFPTTLEVHWKEKPTSSKCERIPACSSTPGPALFSSYPSQIHLKTLACLAKENYTKNGFSMRVLFYFIKPKKRPMPNVVHKSERGNLARHESSRLRVTHSRERR